MSAQPSTLLSPAVDVSGVSFRYGDKPALQDVSFQVRPAVLFGLLGPNGGGKTTLFRLISTLLPLQQGSIRLLGLDVLSQADAIRRQIGVTFQAPSLDRKLSVFENLACHARLYGLSGNTLASRIQELLARLGLSERARDKVESLSGGLARRVEIAKGLLHSPRLLLLDEPSTGLDPGARLDLWRYLASLRDESGVTVICTTHLMEEAERCDDLALLDHGRIVAQGSPAELRRSLGGDCLTIRGTEPETLAAEITARFGVSVRQVGGELRIDAQNDHSLLGHVLDAFGPRIEAVSLARPTLEDVFVERTGHRFWNE
ncbi:MAG TPA: ABC transporter ATP-binding protein [Planctomycetaceae bacterium]|nr:ABC transporter ATP-binding protein [Planctomycetaceae bacterium]